VAELERERRLRLAADDEAARAADAIEAERLREHARAAEDVQQLRAQQREARAWYEPCWVTESLAHLSHTLLAMACKT
jgi:hypothetical protein